MRFIETILNFLKERKELKNNKSNSSNSSMTNEAIEPIEIFKDNLNPSTNIKVKAESSIHSSKEQEESLLEKLRKNNNLQTINEYEEKEYKPSEKTLRKYGLIKEEPQQNWYGTLCTTKNGEEVKSKWEKYIADFLFDRGIKYMYEKNTIVWPWIPIKLDFYLIEYDLYLEYFGLPNLPEYREKMKLKMREYFDYWIKCIMLFPEDFKTGQYKAKILEKIEKLSK